MARIGVGFCFGAPAASPLIADYVMRDSVGKAASFVGIGYVLGEVLSMGVLFNVTKDMSPYFAFLTVACSGAFCSSLFLCFVKEPRLRTKKNSQKKS